WANSGKRKPAGRPTRGLPPTTACLVPGLRTGSGQLQQAVAD
ncbi:MAG: hypothetical protein AVDCRST_MAG56-7729, partial [uncultured Cytophagales bacterium]